MAQEVLLFISLIIGIATLLSIFSRLIRQPPIIAYLFAGVLVGPLFLNLIGTGSSSEMIQLFAHIGVAFLLFIVGLSLDLRVLKELGKLSAIAGILEISLTGGIGFLIALGLGFKSMTALYIAAALAFSSTVVVVKILADKKELETLHGRIALGILIIEDFVAAIALMAIPLINAQKGLSSIFIELGIALMLIAAIFLFSHFVLNKFLNFLARSPETLFLFGIAWALAIATLFGAFGFSIEIGALIAGMSLASSKYNLDLGGKIKPLRDFFVVLFFVFFGSQLTGNISMALITNAILFSIFIVIGKPIIVMTVLRMFGYKKRVNFLAGASLAQISEFSLIITLLGFNLGQLSQEIMSLAVLIAIITIGASSYSLYYSRSIFNKLSRFLDFLESKKQRAYNEECKEPFEIVLFGYHRIGYKLLKTLKKMKVPFVVVDYNPKVILSLEKEGVNCIFGDAGDKDFLGEICLDRAKLVISTIPDESSNWLIKEKLSEINSKATFIATAEQPRDALDLYEAGADYVIIPHHLGGQYAANMIESYHTNKEKYRAEGEKHIKELKEARDKSKFSGTNII